MTYPMDEYERTLFALNQYRVLAADDDGAALPSTEKPVEPGEYFADVPRLIRLLSRIGDLPAETVPTDSALYEGALVGGVQRFQSHHKASSSWRTRTRSGVCSCSSVVVSMRPSGSSPWSAGGASVRSRGSRDCSEPARISIAGFRWRTRCRARSRSRNEGRGRAGSRPQDSRFAFATRDYNFPLVLDRAGQYSTERTIARDQSSSEMDLGQQLRVGYSAG